MDPQDTFHLYSYYCSSCCHRIIIAAHLKSIPLQFSYIDLGAKEQRSSEYKDGLNPSGSVPTLVVQHPTGSKTIIRQSMTILEYFEERFPDRCPLLPPIASWEERVQVRDLVNIIAIDTQPPTNSRIAQRVKAIQNSLDDQVSFVKQTFTDGFQAYEALITQAGAAESKYSVGQQVTMADVVLVPAIDQAFMYRMSLDSVPNIKRIYHSLKELEAFKAADWRNQGDTPEKFRSHT